VPGERRVGWPQVLDRPRELVGQGGQRLALAVCGRQPAEGVWSGRRRAEEAPGRFADGPCARRVADRRAGGALARARRCWGALDQTAVGGASVPAWAPRDRVKRRAPHPAPPLAEPWDGTQPSARVGVRRLGRVEERPLDVAAFGPRGIGQARGDPVAVGWVGDLPPQLGQMVRAVGVLDLGQSRGTVMHQVQPAPEERAGRPPVGGIDGGLREPPPPPEAREFLGLDLVGVRLAARDGVPGEGRPKDDGHPFLGTEVSQPGPP
jgi:hypothetical protein